MAKKKTEEKALNIDSILFNCKKLCVQHVTQAHFLKKEI